MYGVMKTRGSEREPLCVCVCVCVCVCERESSDPQQSELIDLECELRIEPTRKREQLLQIVSGGGLC